MRPHLLVLDDEEGMCRLLSAFFERKGYDVTTAVAAGEAMELADRATFDVCIFDLNLAGENGLELVGVFKTNFPNLPIVIYTGVEDEAALEMAMIRGANGFLRKGEPLENLYEAVKTYVADGK